MRIRSKQRTNHSKTTSAEPRVFVGLFEIAGYYGRIVDHLRGTGYPISFIEVTTHRFDYKSEMPRSDYKYESFLKSTAQSRKSLFSQIKFRIVGIHLFFWAIQNHDVFVFVAGKSFSKRNLDLYVIRLMKKRVVSFVAHGSESRPAYMDGAIWGIALKSKDPIRTVKKFAQSQRSSMRRLERTSNSIIANPLASQFLRRSFVSSTNIGLPGPKLPASSDDCRTASQSGTIILHAPSDRSAKGSDEISLMISRLKEKHKDIIYIELKDVPNAVVLSKIAEADIVIDQLYSDTPLAGIGMEAASFGTAVISGSYGTVEMDLISRRSEIPPAFVVHPSCFEDSLEQLIADSEYRKNMARICKEYLDMNWSIDKISNRFLSIVVGAFPSSWIIDPNDVSYIHGACISEQILVDIWTKGLDRYGINFFMLDKRPDLLKQMRALILKARS
jgi:hypothetical protein